MDELELDDMAVLDEGGGKVCLVAGGPDDPGVWTHLGADEVRLLVDWLTAWLAEERAAPVGDDYAELPPSVWAAGGRPGHDC